MRRFMLMCASLLLAGSVQAVLAAEPTVAGVKSANVFQLAPDADSDPKYKDQSNAQRGQVQPGNNAPMWRQVGQGVTGYSSLPKSQAPEAGPHASALPSCATFRMTRIVQDDFGSLKRFRRFASYP